MPKRFSLTFAAILATVMLAGPAYPQKASDMQIVSGDILRLQNLVMDLQRSVDTRNSNLQTLLERVVDKVNLMGGEIQAGVQTSVQNGIQNNTQNNQATAEKLTRMIEDVKAQNDRNDKALAGSIAALGVEMDKLNAGLVEKLGDNLGNKINERTDRVGAQITKTITDQFNEKIDKLGDNVNGKMTQNFNGLQLQLNALSEQMAKLLAQAKTVPLPSPEQLLREAYSDCALGAYSLCWDELTDLLTKFPEHAVAPRADLLRADISYNQAKWEQAALAYDVIFQKYRDPDIKRTALLKRGLSEEKQKQTAAAIETGKRVLAEYPGPSAEVLAAEEMLKRLVPPTPPAPPARGGAAATPPRG